MKHNEINIAIDGYSSCGKSSIAKDISRNFNMIYVDSGAMYRAVTLFCLENNIIENKKINQIKLIDSLNTIDIKYNYNKSLNVSEIFLNGENVEKKIRNKLIKIQQDICANKNVVMDGRDIATKVMPNAELKFFITANIETRAKRRFDELKKTDCLITFDEVLNNLNERDSDDINRSINPLIKSNDAIVIDNTSLNFAQQNKLIFNHIHDATN